MRLALLVALSLPLACNALKKGPTDAGPDVEVEAAPQAPEPAPEAGPAAAPPPGASATHAAAVHSMGSPAPGNACTGKEGVNGLACAPGGFEELECGSGVWRVLQTCRGAGGCKAEGAVIHCDPGNPVASDACVAGSAPRCTDTHSLLSCQNGKWVASMCVPPGKCVPNAKNGVAGCK